MTLRSKICNKLWSGPKDGIKTQSVITTIQNERPLRNRVAPLTADICSSMATVLVVG